VLVSDADGKVLWRSPEVRDANHPLAFGEFDFGSSLPEFAGDVDRDGTVEMLAPAAGANSYRARLSAQDHVNSNGVALKRVGDIVRQDCANVHRGTHRDAEDQVDGRFADAAQREALSAMRFRVIGGATAVNRIVNGTPVVKVTIDGDEARVEIVSD
jgi:hypothetical protein